MNPISMLPLPPPSKVDYPDGFFYKNVAKHLIKDTIRLMGNGLPIDLERVHELEIELDSILKKVQETVDNNKFIKGFLDYKYPFVAKQIEEELQSKMRTPKYYLKEFKPGDMIHRSYYMSVFIEQHLDELYDLIEPVEEVAEGIPKWTVKDVKPLAENYHELKRLIRKKTDPSYPIAKEAMRRLAHDKSAIYNKSYYDKIEDITYANIMEPFNPNSSVQKKEFFEWLEVEPLAYSKDTGEASWGRDQVEELLKTETDPDLQELYQALVDHSFAAIVRQNFINAFYKYTILHEDGVHRLHGNYRLLGAKTG